MRDLTTHELSQVNGGYYFYSAVDGLETGIVWGSIIALGSLFSAAPLGFATAMVTGAWVGAAIGAGRELAVHMDLALLDSMRAPAASEPAEVAAA